MNTESYFREGNFYWLLKCQELGKREGGERDTLHVRQSSSAGRCGLLNVRSFLVISSTLYFYKKNQQSERRTISLYSCAGEIVFTIYRFHPASAAGGVLSFTPVPFLELKAKQRTRTVR